VRLQLKPALRSVWRAPDVVQIGLSARHGTLLAGVTATDATLLEMLRDGVDPRGAAADRPRGRELLRLLHESGVLVPARAGRAALARLGPDRDRLAADAAVWSVVHPQAGDGWELLAGRAARQVVVVGAGRTGTMLAVTLAAAGVGRINVSDPRPVLPGDLSPGGHALADVGRPRQDSAGDAVARLAHREPPRDAGRLLIPAAPGRARRRPDLVVLVEHSAADARRAGALLSADIPHLSVVIRDGDAVVGPLVLPGRGPCLRCLDLHRGDRDPAWPQVLAQLLRPVPGTAEPEESALSVLVAGLAALQVLGHLDGLAPPAASGATLEVELPGGLACRRAWPAHPRCGCHWPPADRPVARTPIRAPGSPARPAWPAG